jgi:hypothetical protein
MAVWPTSLVQQVTADGYEETYLESAIHSSMSVGRKNRLRDPSVIKTYNVRVPLSDDDKDTLFGFWSTTISNGTGSFDWVKFDDGVTSHSYKMLSDPDITAVGNGIWYVTLKLIDAAPQRVIDTTIIPSAASWPTTLPQGANVSGWKESWNGYSLRSGLMPGKNFRSRGSLTEKRLSISMMITLAQKAIFEVWYEDDLVLGAKPFTCSAWTTGATERYVMLTPPKFNALGAGLFNLSLEVVSL